MDAKVTVEERARRILASKYVTGPPPPEWMPRQALLIEDAREIATHILAADSQLAELDAQIKRAEALVAARNAQIVERELQIAEMRKVTGPKCPKCERLAIEHALSEFDPPCTAEYPEGGGYNLTCGYGRESRLHDLNYSSDGTEHIYAPAFEAHPPTPVVEQWLDTRRNWFRERSGDKYLWAAPAVPSELGLEANDATE